MRLRGVLFAVTFAFTVPVAVVVAVVDPRTLTEVRGVDARRVVVGGFVLLPPLNRVDGRLAGGEALLPRAPPAPPPKPVSPLMAFGSSSTAPVPLLLPSALGFFHQAWG